MASNSGVPRRRSYGTGDGRFNSPLRLCFVSDDALVAVAGRDNDRVSVLSVASNFVRNMGVGVLPRPHGVARSLCDELVVADANHSRVALLDASGELLQALGSGCIRGAVFKFEHDYDKQQCWVWAQFTTLT